MTGFGRVVSRVPGLVVLMALTLVGTGLPARAQDNHVQRYGEEDKEESPSQKAAKKEAERAYQRSLGNIPAQQNTDPWGIARGDGAASKPAAKAAAKTTSPKPKPTNSTAADAKTGSATKQ